MFKCEFCGEKQYAYMHKLKLWSCEGRQSETCMVSSPRHRVVEEEKNINENGDIEYEGEKGHTDLTLSFSQEMSW